MLYWKLSESVLRSDSQDTKHLLTQVIILKQITFLLPQLPHIRAVERLVTTSQFVFCECGFSQLFHLF